MKIKSEILKITEKQQQNQHIVYPAPIVKKIKTTNSDNKNKSIDIGLTSDSFIFRNIEKKLNDLIFNIQSNNEHNLEFEIIKLIEQFKENLCKIDSSKFNITEQQQIEKISENIFLYFKHFSILPYQERHHLLLPNNKTSYSVLIEQFVNINNQIQGIIKNKFLQNASLFFNDIDEFDIFFTSQIDFYDNFIS